MLIDILAALIVFAFAVFGYQRGFVFQVVKLFGIMLAFFGCYRAGRATARIFPAWEGVAPVVRVYGLTILSFFFIILTVNLIGILVREMIFHGREPGHRKRDKVRGLALGVLDGGFWAVMFLFVIAALPRSFQRSVPHLPEQITSSLFVALTRPLNFLADPDLLVTDSHREVSALSVMLEFLGDADRMRRLRAAGFTDPLWEDLRLKALSADPDARRLASAGERHKAILHPLLAEVLTDRTLMDAILQAEYPLDPVGKEAMESEALRDDSPDDLPDEMSVEAQQIP
ncbi:MAG: CvpA family protein [Deltaproteobacteria bacterium]|nr:CvpA family protein [Deltaproteobacteria bacterium]